MPQFLNEGNPGWGNALSSIGSSLANWGMNQMQIKQEREQRAQDLAREEELWKQHTDTALRLGAPQERVQEVRDAQTGAVMEQRQRLKLGSAVQGTASEWENVGDPTAVAAKRTFDASLGGSHDDQGNFYPNQTAQDFILKEKLAGRTVNAGAAGPPVDKAANWRIEDTDQGKVRVNILTGETAPLEVGGKPIMQAAKGTSGLSAADKKQVFAANQKLASIDALEHQLDNVQSHFDKLKNTYSAGPGGGLLPTEAGKNFDSSVALLGPLMRQLTRVPGEGSQSDYEAKLMEKANLSRNSYEGTTQQQIQEMRELLNNMRAGHQLTLESYGMEYKPPGKGAPKGGNTPAEGGKNPAPVGKIVTAPDGKRYRIVGGDADDPDVEPVP